MKVKILQDVIANIEGRSVRLKEGDVLDISTEDAENLVFGGYAENTRAAAKVKIQPKGKPLNTKNVKGE